MSLKTTSKIGPMRLPKLLLPLLLLKSIFSADAKYIVLPSGDHGYSIRCDNDGMNSCYELAGDICRHGYTVQNQSAQAGFVAENSSSIGPNLLLGGVSGSSSGSARSTSDNGLLVLCKDPEEMERARLLRVQATKAADEAERMRHANNMLLIGCGIVAVILTGIFIAAASN